MDEKVESRSGEEHDENGDTEYWWNGRNYGSVLPEDLIDAELATSEKDKSEGE